MADRRSLGSAFNLTPEKRAFIAGEGCVPSTSGLAPNAELGVGEGLPTDKAVLALPEPGQPHPRAGRRTPRPPDSAEGRSSPDAAESDTELLLGRILVPLTTRLQPRTADALRRACLEQRLRRRQPCTQQEMVEAALQDWLRRQAFLPPN